MSTTTPTNSPDSMVTVKVTYDGTTRRVKMPLREMVPRVLEEHIRTFLHIPAEQKAMIERYSDSAAAFVLLDSSNMAVYKQLYRAAKAKSKLKLRVTMLEQEPKAVPKPVSVQDVPETSANAVNPEPATASSQTSLPLRTSSAFSKEYDPFLLNNAAKYIAENKDALQDFESRLSCLVNRGTNHSTNGQRSVQSEAKSDVAPVTFGVSCNNCERSVPDAHYHCSTCDDGDFDLCQSCIDQGITCHSDDHWLIKRTVVDGHIVKSSTEKISPKPKPKPKAAKPKAAKPEPQLPSIRYPICTPPFGVSSIAPAVPNITSPAALSAIPIGSRRTCNTCLTELPEAEFLHCDSCEDFDLCQPCFSRDAHGHHPMHAFSTAVAGTRMPDYIKVKMAPGRNKAHLAICDGCDKNITGVRHKCLDCPDWDYCADCVVNAGFVHPSHRFAPIYEPLAEAANVCLASQPIHMGICCDGPMCKSAGSWPAYIRGTRYKCAVCHDLDFCASCEANPANEHNKTHPLIKFKTPVRHVSVTTTGEHHDGKQMQLMGDRFAAEEKVSSSNNSVNAVKTVVDVKPEEPEVKEEKTADKEPEIKTEETVKVKAEEKQASPSAAAYPTFNENDLRATFVRDTVADGTILPLNHVFEQTWSLRNDSNTPWPAGCAVKFIGGDYMGHVDSAHPAGISELVSASESTVCYSKLAPGQEFQFNVLLRTPARAGKFISYWRLTTPDGYRFGDRLWCEVNARSVKPESPKPKEGGDSQASSTMIFPKLEKESPATSMHQDVSTAPASSLPEEASVASDLPEEQLEGEEWDASEDGFLTDEEYDILDASDEEYLEEQQRKMLAK